MFTIADYCAAYARGTTVAAALREVLRRIAAHDDPAIFITLRSHDDLMAEAETLDREGRRDRPLYGIPVAVKDNIDVAGLPTTAACPDFAYQPAADTPAVARLRAAGALIIGKTNLDQFAAGLVGVRSPYGIPRNTFDAKLVPGGSSSGSAVAVAAGLVPIALGTDTAGSGRVPAGLNNLVGLKPSLGAVPTRGVLPACRTLDCVSVFALDVVDAWTAFEVIAGFDPSDPFSRELALGAPGPLAPGLRIGLPDRASRRFGGEAASEAAFDRLVAELTRHTTEPQAIDLQPFFDTAGLLYHGAFVAERYQAIRQFFEAMPEGVHPVTRSIIGQATRFSAADAFGDLYRLKELQRATGAVWSEIDVLAVPTFPRPRTLVDLEADPVGPNTELGTYTNFVNLLDLCALTVPGALRPDGLPSSLTLLAPAGRDALLASLGHALQKTAAATLGATGAPYVAQDWPAGSPSEDEIELVVVGAHLSGLPLNHELTSRGARLIRATTTVADHRLFALPGGPPERPGLLRVAPNTGATIAVEVWSLTPAAFGAFVAAVPPPLSIGTLELADGTSAKGFLVEALATEDAQDISASGGWRAYLANLPR